MPELINNYQPADNSMADKTVLITGAAGGLGSSLAHAAAGLGANLVLLDNNEKALNKVHDSIEAETGKQPGLYPLDIRGANTDDYQQLADTINEVFNGLNGLVHCAATLGQISPFDNIDAKHWQDTFTTNLHGPVLMTQSLLPLIRRSGNGSIIFTTDDKSSAYWGAYGVSKASVITTMRIIADELDSLIDTNENFPVTCNAINPGPMRTGIRSSAYPGEDPNTISAAQEKVPAFLYLLSDEARSMNGNLIEL